MKKVIFKKFNGTGELSRHLASAVVTKTFAEAEKSGSICETSSYAEFAHTKTYQEADELLLFGCKELQKKIEDAGVRKLRLQLNNYQNRRKVYSSVVGFSVNVPKYLTGSPTCMINVKQTKVRSRVINFMYNTTVSCNVSAARIVRAAAKIVQATMIIEAGGIRVNLWTGECFKSKNSSDPVCVWICKVKEAGQRMDTLKMSYPIAHPSMLRRQWFKLLETTEGVPESYVDGYGRVINSEKECLQALKTAGVNNIQRALCFDDIEYLSAEDIAKKIVEGAK